jgi:hypothetical protein
VAREHGLWFHVDGAYGGAGLFAPSVRHRYDGIEHADSFVVDPHKWLFAPFDCAALIYREPDLARAVHTQDASYLDVIHDRPAEWNPTDYAYHLTRRARGPAAVVLARGARRAGLHRRDRGRDRPGPRHRSRDPDPAVPRTDPRARPRHRAVPPAGWGPADYTRWADALLADQVAFISAVGVGGARTVARFAFLHPETPMHLVREVLDRMA